MADPVEMTIGMSGNNILTNSVGLLYDASLYIGLSGMSGLSGTTGIIGWSGQSGLSGWSGLSGESGYSGFSGWSGWSGKSGTPQWCPSAPTSWYGGWDFVVSYSMWKHMLDWHSGWYGTPLESGSYVVQTDVPGWWAPGKILFDLSYLKLARDNPPGYGEVTDAFVFNHAKSRAYCSNDDRFVLAAQESSPSWPFSGNMGLMVFQRGLKYWSALAPNYYSAPGPWTDPSGSPASIFRVLVSPRARLLFNYIQDVDVVPHWAPRESRWSVPSL